jgi:hypothetical protein
VEAEEIYTHSNERGAEIKEERETKGRRRSAAAIPLLLPLLLIKVIIIMI